MRRIVQSFRMETELNAVAATRMCIERVRLAPLCFSAQYIAEMWSVDKILKVRRGRWRRGETGRGGVGSAARRLLSHGAAPHTNTHRCWS